MFRVMKKGNQKIKVYGWGVTRNGWEYYFIDNKHRSDIRTALVCGFETEIGSVSQKEIEPYLVMYSMGDSLNELAPAPNWKWESEKVEM